MKKKENNNNNIIKYKNIIKIYETQILRITCEIFQQVPHDHINLVKYS